MAKRKKKNAFRMGLLKYALCLLCVFGIGMCVLYLYLVAYEDSQISHAIKEYTAALSSVESDSDAQIILEQINSEFEDAKTAEKNVKKVVNKIEFHKDFSKSDEETQSYILKYKGNQIGDVSFIKTDGENIFGLTSWKIKDNNMDVNGLLSNEVIGVPEDWRVYVNDTLVDESYITNKNLPYTGYEQFYDETNTLGLPVLNEYTVTNLFGDVKTVVVDPNGKKYSKEEINADLFLEDASESDLTRAEAYIKPFISYYVTCLSNANHDATGNFINISGYLYPYGSLYNRLAQAITGMSWANSAGDTLLNCTINDLKKFGTNYYICDVSYEVETVGTKGAVQNSFQAKILLFSSGTTFLVQDIANY